MLQSYRIAWGITIIAQFAFVHFVEFHSPKDTLFDFVLFTSVRQACVAFSKSAI
jgi:hypothetical protein